MCMNLSFNSFLNFFCCESLYLYNLLALGMCNVYMDWSRFLNQARRFLNLKKKKKVSKSKPKDLKIKRVTRFKIHTLRIIPKNNNN